MKVHLIEEKRSGTMEVVIGYWRFRVTKWWELPLRRMEASDRSSNVVAGDGLNGYEARGDGDTHALKHLTTIVWEDYGWIGGRFA